MQARLRPARGHGPQPNEAETRAKVESMLQNLGARVLEALKSGGQQFRKFDDAYAGKVRDAFGVTDDSVSAPMRKTVGAVLGSPATYGPSRPVDGATGRTRDFENIGERIGGYAIPATGALARYGVPTAAAIGLADLTGRFYDAASEEEIF